MKYHHLFSIPVFVGLTASVPTAAADDAGDRFYADVVYLFNSTSEVNTANTDFEGDNGQAAYFGYRILPALSLEAGGVFFDPIDSTQTSDEHTVNTEHDVQGYTLGVRSNVSFADLFQLWGGVGLYRWDSTFNYQIRYRDFPGITRTGSAGSGSGEDVYYRVGVTLPLTEAFSVSVESAHFELSDFFSNAGGEVESTDFDQRYIGLGLEYTF